MRSTVYERSKDTGFLSNQDNPFARRPPVKAASMTVTAPSGGPEDEEEEGDEGGEPSDFAPASEDETAPSDPAAEAGGHHGTLKKPVDLVSGKLIIRLDDGQLYELKKLQGQDSQPSPSGFDEFPIQGY